jgi:two-component system sensor histidine kinase KdpD
MNSVRAVLRVAACAATVGAVVLVYRKVLVVNPTTVALTYLLIVLGISAVWRLRYAVITALIATACFNFFFLPPVGTFTIADPQNWVALFAFLVAAVVASQLAERAHRNADIANQRRREVDRLYTFSQRLLLTENAVELLNAIPMYVVEIFGVRAAALFVATRQEFYRSSPDAGALDPDRLKTVSLRGEAVADSEGGVCIAPVRMGVQPAGSIGVSGAPLSLQTLEAIGSLIAIAIERVGAIETLSRTEAARQGERLRSALLDSVTHDLRTPLMSIKASVTGLISDKAMAEADRDELLTVIDEEADRLNRLVGEATEMAALDANEVELHLEPRQISEVIETALGEYAERLKNHPVEVHLAPNLPAVRMDSARIREVLLQLLENAAKYSDAGSRISLTAEVKDRYLVTSVADRGAGIDDFEQSVIFDKFYRGRQQRGQSPGTGMGLSIAKAIVEAHKGTIAATSQLGHGSVFSFALPL